MSDIPDLEHISEKNSIVEEFKQQEILSEEDLLDDMSYNTDFNKKIQSTEKDPDPPPEK